MCSLCTTQCSICSVHCAMTWHNPQYNALCDMHSCSWKVSSFPCTGYIRPCTAMHSHAQPCTACLFARTAYSSPVKVVSSGLLRYLTHCGFLSSQFLLNLLRQAEECTTLQCSLRCLESVHFIELFTVQ